MTRYAYTAVLSDRDVCILEIECELEVSVDLPDGEFEMSIDEVLVNGRNLLRSGYSTFKAIGLDIVDMAERDAAFIDLVKATEDIVSRSKGYGDLEASFTRAA